MKELFVFFIFVLWGYTWYRHWGRWNPNLLKQNIQAGLFCLIVLLGAASVQGAIGTMRQSIIYRDLSIVVHQQGPHFVVAHKYAMIKKWEFTRYLPFYYEEVEVELSFARLRQLEDQLEEEGHTDF